MLWSAYDGPGTYWEKARKYSLALIGTDSLGLRWQPNRFPAVAESFQPETLSPAMQTLTGFNHDRPTSQVIVETYYFEANQGDYPDDSPWWTRDKNGKRITFWEGCYDMNVDDPSYRAHIARRIDATDQAGGPGLTGVYLDNLRFEPAAKRGWIQLMQMLRKARADRFIMANAGWDSTDLEWIAPYLNGIMYEDSVDHTKDGDQEAFYKRVQKYDALLRGSKRSIVEVFGKRNDSDKAWRELIRTLVYTNDCFLYSDSTYGHRHSWRPEWDPKLGLAIDPPQTPCGKLVSRRFQHGLIFWNPTNAAKSAPLTAPMVDARTGESRSTVDLPPKTGVYLISAS